MTPFMLAEAGEVVAWILLALAILVGIIFLGVFIPLFGLWIQALAVRAGVGIFELIGMKLRKVRPSIIVLSRIQDVRAGHQTTWL